MSHGPIINIHQHPIPDYYKRALERVGIHGSGEILGPIGASRFSSI